MRLTIYTTELERFAEINEAYAEFFPSDPPARAAVGVVALPKGATVEIDAVVRPVDFRPMQLLLFTVLGACAMVFGYAFGLAGPVCGLLFLGGVFTGAFLRAAQPIIDWVTRP